MTKNLFPASFSPLAQQIGWDDVPVVHKPSLFCAEDPWYSYKYISITEVFSWIALPGDWCQFGVFRRATARVFEAVIPKGRKLHLFDSFEGLPESWAHGGWKQGAFRVPDASIPTFDSRKVVLHKGWFNATVPAFRQQHDEPLAFLHIDSDLYSSATDVLCGLNDLIVPDTILLFDEFFMRQGANVSDDECRALQDWSARFGRQWKLLWRTNWVQAAVRIL